jgi:hypothetical protein
MIPAGRTPLGTTDIAKRMGRKTLPRDAADLLPAPISRTGAQTRIWDADQVEAKLADQEVPPLPTSESPEDLLDREESRTELSKLGLDLKPEAWRSYINHGYGPKPDKVVCGVAHFSRRTIAEWLSQRPGEGAGAGRPKGVKDSKPRDRSSDPRHAKAVARRERIARMLQENSGTTAAQIAEAEGISERQAFRILGELNSGK